MHSGLRSGISKDSSSNGKALGDLATVLEEVDGGRQRRDYAVLGFEGAIPLKNYHQMIQALRDEIHSPVAKETIPEDLDLLSIFKIPAEIFGDAPIDHHDSLAKESKVSAQRCFISGISRYYNNILMAIQGNLSLICLSLGNNHAYLPIIKSAEELVQSGSFAISLLLGYLAERRTVARKLRFNHLVAEVDPMQSCSLGEKERQQFERWIKAVSKFEGLTHIAGRSARSFDRLLRSVANWAEWLRLAGELDCTISERLLKIKELAEAGYWISAKLLAFAGQGNFKLQRLPLKNIIDTALIDFKTLYPNIDFKRYSCPAGIEIVADPGHFSQVLHELLQNAVESIPNGGKIAISVKKLTLPRQNSKWTSSVIGSFAVISVRDSGFGLNEDIEKKIFDPFFTTKPAGKRAGSNKHAGLGLSMVYGVVKQLGGDFVIESKSGRGTTATLLLPRV